MSITSEIIRGHTETIILYQLLEKDSYGYEINKAIKEKTNGEYEVKEATMYTAFRRLEENGLIHFYWGEEGAGARRKYYSITDKGREVFEESKKEWQVAKRIIDCLIGQ